MVPPVTWICEGSTEIEYVITQSGSSDVVAVQPLSPGFPDYWAVQGPAAGAIHLKMGALLFPAKPGGRGMLSRENQ